MTLEKIIEFRPAWDKRNSDPKLNYGIHGVEIAFCLKGTQGAVQFVFYTGWLLPETLGVVDNTDLWKYPDLLTERNKNLPYPNPADLGYHSPIPRYEDQSAIENCRLLDGRPCYYDGSTLNAYPIFATLVKEGHEGVWIQLENYYNEVFGSGERKPALDTGADIC